MAANAGGCYCPANQPLGGCDAGYTCLPDLHCYEVIPSIPCPAIPCPQLSTKPTCAPSGQSCICTATLATNGDSCYQIGQVCDETFATPTCRLPLLGEPCAPNTGCQPASVPPLICGADPSGTHLYVCSATCSSNKDCANGWQYCSVPDGGTIGRCIDNPCDGAYARCSLHLPGGATATQGLCLPFGVLQTNPNGTKQAVAFGLCLEASSQSGSSGIPCDRLFRRGIDGGACDDGGPGCFCNLINVCTPSGTCGQACNLADAGVCLDGTLHCKKIDPRPFSTARDPDSGILEGSGACQ